MTGKRWTALIIIIVIATILAIGIRAIITPPPQDQVTLQLKWLRNAGFAGDLIALNQNLWGDLNVTIQPGGVGIEPVKAVTSGRADFGIANGDQLLQAVADGAPIVAIGLTYQVNPLAWIVKEDSQITSVEDFRGKRIGLTYLDDEAIFYAMLDSAGLADDELTIVNVKFDLSPFKTGDVDAFPVFRNTQGIALALEMESSGTKTRFIGPESVGIVSYANVYFTTTKTATERPDVVKEFMKGVALGWERAKLSPAQSATIVAQFDQEGNTQQEIASSLAATVQLVFPTDGAKFGEMSMDGWIATQDLLVRLKRFRTRPDLRSMFTNDYLPEQ